MQSSSIAKMNQSKQFTSNVFPEKIITIEEENKHDRKTEVSIEKKTNERKKIIHEFFQDLKIKKLNPEKSEDNKTKGIVKFFDKKKKFGFIMIGSEKKNDIFFHYDDVIDKLKFSCEFLNTAKSKNIIKVKFLVTDYKSKYKNCKKAIEIEEI